MKMAMMRYLIVNADDFGASRGVNSAIVELHQLGVLSSTSVMIDMPAAMQAAAVKLISFRDLPLRTIQPQSL